MWNRDLSESIRLLLSVLFATLSLTMQSMASEILIDEWRLGTRVGIGSELVTGIHDVVVNPFSDSHTLALGNSFANSFYQFGWDDSGLAEFLITANHAAAGTVGPLIQSLSSGNIWLTPSVESILTLDAVYDYALGNGDRQLNYAVGAGGGTGGIGVSHQIIPVIGHPSSGQLTFHDELLLQPGVEYTLAYYMIHRSVSGSPDSLSSGSGSVQFSIIPIPEPATGALLAPAMLLAFRRRRHP